MICFYKVPFSFLSFCLFLETAALILHCLSLGFVLRGLGRKPRLTPESLLETAVLFQLLLPGQQLADLCYHTESGFVYAEGHPVPSLLLLLLLTVLSLMQVRRDRVWYPLAAPALALLTLPRVQSLAGDLDLLLFPLALLLWLLREGHLTLVLSRRRETQLTALSIKEAVDSLNTGLLFFRENGMVVLQNSAMQHLMLQLTGRLQNNGVRFYETLLRGPLEPPCRREPLEGQLLCRLPDDTVRSFTLHTLRDGPVKYRLLIASDITELWQAGEDLMQQNRKLEARNRELQKVLGSLEEICEAETIVQAKVRVHDVLGQRISLLLRAMREHRQPDEALLRSFAEGLPRELTRAVSDGGYSLDTLARVFRDLGVSIHVDGWLPAREDLARIFYEITAEAVTNAVRHGYATSVDVLFTETEDAFTLEISNLGMLPRGPVIEGGGLTEMRKKAERLGGSFRYEITDRFRILVSVPKGGQ